MKAKQAAASGNSQRLPSVWRHALSLARLVVVVVGDTNSSKRRSDRNTTLGFGYIRVRAYFGENKMSAFAPIHLVLPSVAIRAEKARDPCNGMVGGRGQSPCVRGE